METLFQWVMFEDSFIFAGINLKIMRASFEDIDPTRLVDDEKLRLHSAGLLQTKWWGAEHAYYSSKGKVRCGHFFDGPVTERVVLNLLNTTQTCIVWQICFHHDLPMENFIWN